MGSRFFSRSTGSGERVVEVFYIPDHQELLGNAGAAGLELAQDIEYATDRSAHRRLYVFRKPSVH